MSAIAPAVPVDRTEKVAALEFWAQRAARVKEHIRATREMLDDLAKELSKAESAVAAIGRELE